MSDSSAKKPKIIVDEDWKTKVQAEKESLEKNATAQQDGAETKENAAAAAADESLPPASFSLLATTVATQALVALGQAAPPGEEKPVVNLNLARHYVDTLTVLDEKTKGNLTGEESNLLTRLLHELRMIFVAVSNDVQQKKDSATG